MDFSTLKATVVRLLGDTVISSEGPSGPSGPTITGGTLYPYDLVADSVNAALIAITSRQWKNTFVDVPGDNTVFTEQMSQVGSPDDMQALADKTQGIADEVQAATDQGGVIDASGMASIKSNQLAQKAQTTAPAKVQ